MSLPQFPCCIKAVVWCTVTRLEKDILKHTKTSSCVWLGGAFMDTFQEPLRGLAIVFSGKFVVMRKLKGVYCKLSTLELQELKSVHVWDEKADIPVANTLNIACLTGWYFHQGHESSENAKILCVTQRSVSTWSVSWACEMHVLINILQMLPRLCCIQSVFIL